MPPVLFDTLYVLSRDRSQKVKGSRSNSFQVLDVSREEISRYRASLVEGGRAIEEPVRACDSSTTNPDAALI